MDVLDVELDSTEKTCDEAQQGRLRKLFLFLFGLPLCFPGSRVGITLSQLFFILRLLVFAQLGAILLTLSLSLLLLFAEYICLGLLKLRH